jgi:alcohol dehydrogenase class IV
MQTMFTLPTFVRFGCGSRRELVPVLRENGVKRVFLVTDKGVAGAGLLEESLQAVRDVGVEVSVFAEAVPNAPDHEVERAAESARAFNPDAVVSFGGGSSIDTAKGVNILLSNPGPLSLYDGVNLVKKPGRLHIAIPTTAGTSSEMTVVAVIADTEKAKKMVRYGCAHSRNRSLCHEHSRESLLRLSAMLSSCKYAYFMALTIRPCSTIGGTAIMMRFISDCVRAF